MLDVLKTLSGLVQTKRTKRQIPPDQKKIVSRQVDKLPEPQKPQQSQQPSGVDKSGEVQAFIREAQARAREITVEAKDEALKIRASAEEEARKRSEALDRREGALEEKERQIESWEKDVTQLRQELTESRDAVIEKLEKAAHMTRDEACEEIVEQVRRTLDKQIALDIREAEERAREEAEAKAKEIIVDAMRHGATDYVAEYTVSVIKVPDEDVKGRIIGKEGRNIRAFESATGVDVDLDEEGIIRLSSFDPVRREIARLVLEKLLRDGRVQPSRIEELVAQVKREVERIMFEEGQKLCHAVGVYNLPSPLVALLGRFKYRYSYGQNMIGHTLEETKIGIAIAEEIGADVNIARLGCLLHDIGKVVMDREGNHVELGVELLKTYGIPQKVIDCVEQHHEDVSFTSIESMIVYIADAISGCRPGARYENYDEYVKRLKDMEDIAKSNPGVVEAFAFQAGRELRVAVDPGDVDDDQATVIAQKIREEVSKKVTVPGSVKITVIREMRITEIVK